MMQASARISAPMAQPLSRSLRAVHSCQTAARVHSNAVTSRQVATKVAFADTIAARPMAEEPQKKYILGELLGSGTAAHVHVGTDTATGLQHAVKILPKRKGNKDRVALIRAEIDMSIKMHSCRHAVRLVDSFEDDRNIYVVHELCCGGDLADLMTAQEGMLTQHEAATIIRCVLEFLEDCHAKDICYGDVKPNNFVLRSLYPSISHLLDPSRPKGLLEVVAVDFGCCQEVDDQCLSELKVTGTPLYMAPEQLRGCHGMEVDIWAAGVMVDGSSFPDTQLSVKPVYMAPQTLRASHGKPVDIWAAGAMLYQLLSDRFPFWDVDLHQIESLGGMAIREGIVHGPVLFPIQPWNTEVHPSAQELILKMLQRDPKKRITASDALKHPWFTHVLQEADVAAHAAL